MPKYIWSSAADSRRIAPPVVLAAGTDHSAVELQDAAHDSVGLVQKLPESAERVRLVALLGTIRRCDDVEELLISQRVCGNYFGEGKSPSVTPWFELGDGRAAVRSLHTGERKTVLAINFEWMRNRGADDRLGPLARSLKVLPGWEDMPDWLEASNYARRLPSGRRFLANQG